MSSTSGTTTRQPGARAGRPARARSAAEQRLALLRAVSDSITGRGRVVGPPGTWVRMDFEDLRGQLRAG